jgi:hypothetical protein
MALNLTKRRSPSELRQLLEVRVRRQAETYSNETRIKSLRELRDLADAELARLEG